VAKLIILSIVLVSVIVPIVFSNGRSPRQSLRRAQWVVLAFIAVWTYLCTSCYPALVPVE
jgi:hypothetical protein